MLDAEHLPLWKRLADPGPRERALLAALVDADTADAATLARLRRDGDAALLRIAIELVRARAKAGARLAGADTIVADVEGVEQATSHAVAMHKARRYATGVPIVDLCCGIGGDAVALAPVGAVRAIDRLPVRAWMAATNAGCASACADVEAFPIPDDAVFHLDPARRGAAGRAWRYADYRPGPAFIERLLARHADGAIKLGPGVAFEDLPGTDAREIEVIAERGTLVQAVLWCGSLARHVGQRTATRLPEGVSFTGAPRPFAAPAAGGFGRFLVEPDPAVERLDLAAAVCAGLPVRPVHPGLGLLTADAPPGSAWLRSFEVLAQMPWRPARVRTWLREHEAGIVTVRTRGRAVDTDAAQRELRGRGDRRLTVFGLRLGPKLVAVITEEEGASAEGARSAAGGGA